MADTRILAPFNIDTCGVGEADILPSQHPPIWGMRPPRREMSQTWMMQEKPLAATACSLNTGCPNSTRRGDYRRSIKVVYLFRRRRKVWITCHFLCAVYNNEDKLYKIIMECKRRTWNLEEIQMYAIDYLSQSWKVQVVLFWNSILRTQD